MKKIKYIISDKLVKLAHKIKFNLALFFFVDYEDMIFYTAKRYFDTEYITSDTYHVLLNDYLFKRIKSKIATSVIFKKDIEQEVILYFYSLYNDYILNKNSHNIAILKIKYKIKLLNLNDDGKELIRDLLIENEK
ncbi:MAG: hypothetical protein KatS3mg096_627 [Candidatus Parcubacteria bacterium]|nr:MAG: hypothetical protein KatS3mg096_627 [Candidatus Parcubacteria bacterium]